MKKIRAKLVTTTEEAFLIRMATDQMKGKPCCYMTTVIKSNKYEALNHSVVVFIFVFGSSRGIMTRNMVEITHPLSIWNGNCWVGFVS